jgi:Gamma-glutamyltranspeptidase
VLDKDGMAVALTTTVNLVFGSMVLDPETGIILNDEVSPHMSQQLFLIALVRWTIFRFQEDLMVLASCLRHVRSSSSPILPN